MTRTLTAEWQPARAEVIQQEDKEEDWHNQALCAQVDSEIFFPEKGGSTRAAKEICGRCAVKAACLAYALENEERFGIWGGLSERERRKLKKKQQQGTS